MICLVVSIQLGMSSSHLTNSIIFQRGWPTINQFLVKTWPQDGDVQQNMGQKPSVLWVKLDFFGVGYGDMDLARQIFFMFVWVDPPVLMAMKNPACSVDFPIKTGLMTLEGTIFRDPICLVVTGTWLLWLSIQLGTIIPTDELIFFRGVAQPPTSSILLCFGGMTIHLPPILMFTGLPQSCRTNAEAFQLWQEYSLLHKIWAMLGGDEVEWAAQIFAM